MKKTALLILCLLPLLSGCGQLRAQSREVEQLRLAETLGLDPAPEGLILSLAAPGDGEASLFVSASGPSVDMAMETLRERSAEQELFCGHLQHILLGEAFAEQGLDALLAAVCRSPDLRVDMPVYLVLDAAARDAMEQAGDGETGVCDLLNGLSVRGGAGLSSAGRILRDLDRQGSALIRALKQEDSPEAESEAKVLVPWGFGVLVGDRLRARLSPEDALAVELLTGELQPCPLLLRDDRGNRVTLELQEGETELLPIWDESGELAGLELRVRVKAAVLEIQGFPRAADSRTLDALNARLEEELSRRIGRVLELSRDLRADFLGLGRRLELDAPFRCRGLSRDLGELLPGLSLRITVQGELRHSHDMN